MSLFNTIRTSSLKKIRPTKSEIKEAEVFQARMLNVWIIDKKGKIVRLHRRYHRVEIIENIEEGKGGS